MDFDKMLQEYLGALIDERFGAQIEPEVKRELVTELQYSFQKLFNMKLFNAFSDEDFAEVEKMAAEGKAEQIPEFAQQKGIKLEEIMRTTMVEFAEQYRKGNGDSES